jgi:ArsR family metal-binding transcriptional regulator
MKKVRSITSSLDDDSQKIRRFVMWIITVYSNKNITMLEFDTEEEAREALKSIQEYKIISEIVY